VSRTRDLGRSRWGFDVVEKEECAKIHLDVEWFTLARRVAGGNHRKNVTSHSNSETKNDAVSGPNFGRR
jgi:hypothetical protein